MDRVTVRLPAVTTKDLCIVPYLRLLALLLTGIILVPSAAHLLELPGKASLDANTYFAVQAIYAGWSAFAVPIFAAILANASLAWLERRTAPGSARWATASTVLIALSLGVFFVWVLPANQATSNWTIKPAEWAAFRTDWEFGHALSAGLVFLAFVSTALATVRSR